MFLFVAAVATMARLCPTQCVMCYRKEALVTSRILLIDFLLQQCVFQALLKRRNKWDEYILFYTYKHYTYEAIRIIHSE